MLCVYAQSDGSCNRRWLGSSGMLAVLNRFVVFAGALQSCRCCALDVGMDLSMVRKWLWGNRGIYIWNTQNCLTKNQLNDPKLSKIHFSKQNHHQSLTNDIIVRNTNATETPSIIQPDRRTTNTNAHKSLAQVINYPQCVLVNYKQLRLPLSGLPQFT